MRMRAARRLVPLVLSVTLVIGGMAGAGNADSRSTKAKGEPIVVALINVENSAQGSFSELRIAAQAAIDYVNEERDGFGGRPLKLEACASNATPEGSASCASQLLAKNPVAFIGGVDQGAFGAAPILASSGVPTLGAVPLLPPQQTSPTSFAFVGVGTSTLSTLTKFAVENLKFKKINMLVPDNPGGMAQANTVIKPALEKLGVTGSKVEFFSASSPDLTPSVTAVTSDDPDAVIVLAASRECPLIMQAAKTIGTDSKLLAVATCAEETVLKNAGANAEGVHIASDYLSSTGTDKQVKLFKKKLKQYQSERVIMNNFTQQGFSTIMNVEALFDSIGGDAISVASILAEVRATNNTANFMAHPYTCNGKAIPSRISICNGNSRVYKVKKGKLVQVGDWINGGELLG